MAGYTRQSIADIINGANITAPPLNSEFNQIATAFDGSSGHSHDGSTGNAPKIDLSTSVDGYLEPINGGVGGRNNTTATANPTASADANLGYAPGSIWMNTLTGAFFVCIVNTSNAAVWVEGLAAYNNSVLPSTTATINLGSSSNKFNNLYLAGGVDAYTVLADSVSADTLSVAQTSTFTGVPTFNGGFVSNASSTVNGGLTVTGNVQLGDAATDSINMVGRVDSNIVPLTDDARDLGTPTNEFRNLYIDGTANVDSLVADTVDINAGTIDGTTIGATTPAAGTFTGVTTGTLATTGNVTLGDTSSDTLTVNAGLSSNIVPTADDAVDLGTASKEFRNLFIDGTANIDALVADTATISGGTISSATVSGGQISGALINNTTIGGTTAAAGTFTNLFANGTVSLGNFVTIGGGTLNNTIIGGTTPAAITGTTITANTGFSGNLTGNVTGNLTGNVAGDVTGNLTGNVTGNVTANSGTSTFNNVTINGSLNMNAGTTATVTGLSTPVNATDAAHKQYVDDSISALVAAAPAALDTLNELAAALNDDANFATTVNNSIATKLSLSGGTMTGNIAMGTNSITGLAAPVAGTDAVNKTYVDTQDGLQVSRSGDSMSGTLDMGSNSVTNVAAPVNGGDATNKTYVDGILGSATAAATSAANALTSEQNAATSESNASTSAQLAQDWAIKTSGTVDGTNYSSKYWATTGDVLTVSSNIAQIQTLSSDLTSGNFVAGTIYDFGAITDAVSGTSGAPNGFIVTAVNNLADIQTVSTSISNVNTVASNIANVNSLGPVSANITTVAGISSAVTNLSSISADVTTASGVAADITTVAGVSSDVTVVSGIAANVTILAGISSAVTNVAGIQSAVSNVSSISSAVSNVSSISANITTVSGISADVTTVAGVAADLSTVAANVTDISNFADVYQGPKASDPSTRNDSSALVGGDLYFNTTSSVMKYYDGSAWYSIVAPTGDMGNQNSNNVNITGGSITNVTLQTDIDFGSI